MDCSSLTLHRLPVRRLAGPVSHAVTGGSTVVRSRTEGPIANRRSQRPISSAIGGIEHTVFADLSRRSGRFCNDGFMCPARRR